MARKTPKVAKPAQGVRRYGPLRHALLAGTALCCVALAPRLALALPQDGKVVQGVAQIIVKSPTEIVVNQSSAKVVIDWASFNIAANEKVVFVQMDQLAQALNRVIGPGASQILGQLSANGIVMLSNPNGILFGPGANVNVQAIIATTSQMSPQAQAAFMTSGKLNFDIASTSPTASVVNRGTITAGQAGLVGLVAPGVENSGLIQAKLGKVQLVSGNTFTLDLYGDKLIKVAVSDKVISQVTTADGQPLAALVSNSGTIEADGGTIILTANAARDIVSTVINMTGIARARSVGTSNGEIVLDGGEAGIVQVAGTLDASGREAGQTGGTAKMLGEKVALADGARIDVAGDAGGGTALVGGNWQGKGPERNAFRTYVDGTASINASAITTGDGGKVVVWADDITRFNGSISVTGGRLGGNGGKVEVSGKGSLDFHGHVDTRAVQGNGGSLLLDPTNIIVATADPGSGAVSQTTAASVDQFADNAAETSWMTPTDLVTLLNSAAVTLQAANDITVSNAINASGNSGNYGLTLQAGRSIAINNNITLRGDFVAVSNMIADNQSNRGAGAGNFTMASGATIDTQIRNGTISIQAYITGTTGSATVEKLTGGSGQIDISAESMIFSGGINSISGSGELVLFTNTYARPVVIGAAGGAGALVIDSAAINAISAGFSKISIGHTSGTGGLIISGAAAFNSPVTLFQDSAGSFTVDAPISTSILSSGLLHFSGGAPVALNASATGTAVSFDGAVTVGADNLTVNAITGTATFSSTVAHGSNTFTVTANDVALSGSWTGTGARVLQPYNVTTRTIGLAGGTGNFALSTTELGYLANGSPSSVTIGASGGIAAITTNSFSFSPTLTLRGGTVSLGGGTFTTLNVTAAGNITQSSALTVSGTTALTAGANAITLDNSGNDFTGAVSLSNSGANNVSLRDTNALDLGTVGVGSGALTVQAGGAITQSGVITQASGAGAVSITAGANAITLANASNDFTGAVSLSNSGANAVAIRDSNAFALGSVSVGNTLAVTAGSAITLNNSVTSGSDQTYTGAVVIAGNNTLSSSGGNVSFSSTINDSSANSHSLTINAGAGTATFGGAVGGTAKLASLGTTASEVRLYGDVTTGGTQSHAGPVKLYGNATLTTTNSNVTFSGIINDQTADTHSLAVSAGSGTVTFDGVIGGSAKLAGLNTTGTSGTINVNGSGISTGGNQIYTGGLAIGASTAFDSGTGTFAAATVSHGTYNVTVTADDVALSGNWTGTGTRALQPTTTSRSIGLAGGAGSFALSATELGYLANGSPSSVTIGKSGGTGAVAANSFNFDDSLTLRGGAVSLGGGTLAALTVSGAGAITQTGAVTVTGATSLAAGSANDITLDNVSNSFGGSVAIPSGKDVILKAGTNPALGAYTVSKLTVNGTQLYPTVAGVGPANSPGNDRTINAVANNQVPVLMNGLTNNSGTSALGAFAASAAGPMAPAQASFATRPLGSGYTVDVFRSDFKVVSISPEMGAVMPNANAAMPSVWGNATTATSPASPVGQTSSSTGAPGTVDGSESRL